MGDCGCQVAEAARRHAPAPAEPRAAGPSLQTDDPAAVAWALRIADPATRARTIQRLQTERGNAFVQRLAEPPEPDLGTRIDAAAAGGRALDRAARAQLEEGIGADLSTVRVHDDAEADSLARTVDAVAFTTGRDIFFRAGAYRPGSHSGLRLLAHEATHVVQQAAGPVAGTPTANGISLSNPSDIHERAAHAQADRVMTQLATRSRGPPGAPASTSASPITPIQRCGGHPSCGCGWSNESETPSEPTLAVQREVVCDEDTGECTETEFGSDGSDAAGSAWMTTDEPPGDGSTDASSLGAGWSETPDADQPSVGSQWSPDDDPAGSDTGAQWSAGPGADGSSVGAEWSAESGASGASNEQAPTNGSLDEGTVANACAAVIHGEVTQKGMDWLDENAWSQPAVIGLDSLTESQRNKRLDATSSIADCTDERSLMTKDCNNRAGVVAALITLITVFLLAIITVAAIAAADKIAAFLTGAGFGAIAAGQVTALLAAAGTVINAVFGLLAGTIVKAWLESKCLEADIAMRKHCDARFSTSTPAPVTPPTMPAPAPTAPPTGAPVPAPSAGPGGGSPGGGGGGGSGGGP
jgi:hypothetical protein